jgi:glycosyltransferase involved in cell wall biosynthesis
MKISVVIPLYNKKNTILRALVSVFSQIYSPLEIIIVNDGSTDGSERLISSLNHSSIRIINQNNLGVSAARNRGIKESNGNWIAFLDADDEWDKNFLKDIDLLHKKYKDCSLLSTGYKFGRPDGTLQNIILKNIKFNGISGRLENYFEVAADSTPPICSSAVVIKKDILKKIGCFPEKIKLGEDLLTWAKIAVIANIAYSKKPLAIFWHDKINPDQIRMPENPDEVGNTLVELYKKDKKRHPGLKKYIAQWYKMRAHLLIDNKKFKDSYKEIMKSIRYNPLNLKIYFFIIYIQLPDAIKLKVNKIFKEIEHNVNN